MRYTIDVNICDVSKFQINGTQPLNDDQPLRGLVFTPDKNSLICLMANGTVRVHDVKTGNETSTFKAVDQYCSFALSPDGSLLAISSAGSKNNHVRIWQTKAGKMLHEFPANGYLVHALAFSPDNSQLACGGADTTIVLWDVAREGKK